MPDLGLPDLPQVMPHRELWIVIYKGCGVLTLSNSLSLQMHLSPLNMACFVQVWKLGNWYCFRLSPSSCCPVDPTQATSRRSPSRRGSCACHPSQMTQWLGDSSILASSPWRMTHRQIWNLWSKEGWSYALENPEVYVTMHVHLVRFTFWSKHQRDISHSCMELLLLLLPFVLCQICSASFWLEYLQLACDLFELERSGESLLSCFASSEL